MEAAMQKWEYKFVVAGAGGDLWVHSIDGKAPDRDQGEHILTNMVAELTAEDWEMMQVLSVREGVIMLVFRREPR